MRIKLGACVLAFALACSLGAADYLPPDLGFRGSFSRGAGDSFQFSFAAGCQLTLDRSGKVSSLHAAGAASIKDKSGRVLALKSGEQTLIRLSYDKDGRVARIAAGPGENFGVSYSRTGQLHSILFPSRGRGIFPKKPE